MHENIKQCPKCQSYHSKFVQQCRTCGYAFGNTNTPEQDTKLKRVDKLALGKTLPAAQKVFQNSKDLRIRITRGYSATPLDYDNLVGGAKPLRDEIARTLGIDDAEHGGVTWEYAQEKGRLNKIEIFSEKI